LAESGPTCLWSPDNPDEEPYYGWGGGRSFAYAFEKYRKYSENHDYRDWLDPWYFNGHRGNLKINVLTGSHASWEKAVHAKHVRHSAKDYKKIPYEPGWNNASFSTSVFRQLSTDRSLPSQKQRDQVNHYTKTAAKETRNNIRPYLKEPMTAVDRAIQRVATLWRASISALKPSIRHMAISPDKPGKREVTCAVENLSKKYRAGDVLVKLTVDQEIIGIKRLGEIAGGATQEFAWQFEAENSAPCTAKLEAIGTYQNLPDLGYAVVKKEIRQSELEKLFNELEETVDAAEALSRESLNFCSKAKSRAAEAQDAASTLRAASRNLTERIEKLKPDLSRLSELQARIDRQHKNAETAAVRLEQSDSQIEKLSLQICRKSEQVPRASKPRAKKLLSDIEQLSSTLKKLRAQGKEYAGQVGEAARQAEKSAERFSETWNLLESVRDQEDGADILLQKRKRLSEADKLIAKTRTKNRRLNHKEKKGRELIAECQELVQAPEYQEKKKKYRDSLDELAGRMERAVQDAGNCSRQAENAAIRARESLNTITEHVSAASALRKTVLESPYADEKAKDKILEKADLTEFLAEMARGYLEEIEDLAADGAFCLILARDQMERDEKDDYMALPDLRGKQANQAREILRRKGFAVRFQNVGKPPSQRLSRRVQGQDPDAGEKVPRSTTVTLRVYDQFDVKDLLASVDCSAHPNTRAVYDPDTHRTRCACKPFFVPNTNGPGCVDCKELKEQFYALLQQGRHREAQSVLSQAGNCSFQGKARAAINAHRNRIMACQKRNIQILRAIRQRSARRAYAMIKDARNFGCTVDSRTITAYNQLVQQIKRERHLQAENRRRQEQTEAFNTFIQGMSAITQNVERQRHQDRTPPTRNRGSNPLTGTLPSTNPGDRLNDYSFSNSPESSGSRHAGVSSGGQSSTTTGGGAGSGMSRSDCIQKFCPVCQSDSEVTMIGVSADEQCEACKKRNAAKIAACEKGRTTGAGNTIESFQKYYLYKCWFRYGREDYETMYYRYYMTGPGEPSLGRRKSQETKSRESQCIRCERIMGPDTRSRIRLSGGADSRRHYINE